MWRSDYNDDTDDDWIFIQNLKKLQLLHIHMNYQFENIEKNVHQLENLKEQAQSMRR